MKSVEECPECGIAIGTVEGWPHTCPGCKADLEALDTLVCAGCGERASTRRASCRACGSPLLYPFNTLREKALKALELGSEAISSGETVTIDGDYKEEQLEWLATYLNEFSDLVAEVEDGVLYIQHYKGDSEEAPVTASVPADNSHSPSNEYGRLFSSGYQPLALPHDLQSRLPEGWFVSAHFVGLKVLMLKPNGWYRVEIHNPDRSVETFQTKIPVQEWQNTGIPNAVMLALETNQRRCVSIGFFDVLNGRYAHLDEDMWCRDAFDEVNGSPRNKGGVFGLVGAMIGIDRGTMGNAMSGSTSERETIKAVFDFCARPGGLFWCARAAFVSSSDSGRL